MISRKTIGSLLLTLLLAGGIAAWSAQRRDECTAYLAGDGHAPSTAVVETGSRRILVPCDAWFVRQPRGVQALCLGVVAGGLVFLGSAWADLRRRRESRGVRGW